MIYLRVGLAIIVCGALLWCAKTVLDWRERSAELDRVQQSYAEYRARITREAEEREQQRRIDREITQGYIATLSKQEADLAAARRELRNVRLRLSAADVSAAACAGAPAAGAGDTGGDGQPALVAGAGEAGEGIDAEAVAERFARCDAAGARLNALIERDRRLSRQ